MIETKFNLIKHIFVFFLFGVNGIVFSQDTLTLNLDKTEGGCVINHPRKKIILARPNCGRTPEISEDSVLQFNLKQGLDILIINYFGELEDGQSPILYKTIQYNMLEGEITFSSTLNLMPGYTVYEKLISTDSTSTFTRFEINGNKSYEIVYSHPKGRLFNIEDTTVTRIEYHYDTDGSIKAIYNYKGDKLNGNYMSYDDSSFVTHWVYKDGHLIDVLNSGCRFLNEKGEVISKEEFFRKFETNSFGQWGYYMFEKNEPYNHLKCCKYVLYSNRYQIPIDGIEAEKLVKRLNKFCK